VTLSAAKRSRKPALSEIEWDLRLLFGGILAIPPRRIGNSSGLPVQWCSQVSESRLGAWFMVSCAIAMTPCLEVGMHWMNNLFHPGRAGRQDLCRGEMKRKVPAFWVSIAALLTLVYWSATLNHPFALELHAWASAHMGLLARSFAQLGVVRLHGVPLENNLPLGGQPDTYNHWPPLYPILLSVAFWMFGESVAVIHAFAVLVNICYFAAFYLLVRRCFDTDVAKLSLFALLTIPVFVKYGTLAWTPNVAMAAISAALYCFVRGTEASLNWKWISAGAAAVTLGVFFSWEPAPVGLVLLGLGIWQRSRIHKIAAAAYAVAGLGAVAIVLVLLVSPSPELRSGLWATIRYYIGGTYHRADIPIHDLAASMSATHKGVTDWLSAMLFYWLPLLGGVIGSLATAGLAIWSWYNRKTRPDVFFAVGGLLGIVVVWVALFPVHVIIHEYQALIAAPLFSIGLGFSLKVGAERLNGAFRWLAILVLPALLLLPLVRQTGKDLRKLPQAEILEYAKDIERNTPASAIVLSPLATMVPVYYSHRHTIRGVNDDEVLREVLRQTGTVFPGSDIYLAIPPDSLAIAQDSLAIPQDSHGPYSFAVPPDSLGQFSCAFSQFPVVKRTPNLILLKVTAGACE